MAGVARDQILDAQQIGGSLPHHLASLAQKIAHRPLLFGVDVTLGKTPNRRMWASQRASE
jgi:hypothetical protein